METEKGVGGATQTETDRLTVLLASTPTPTLSCSDIQSKNSIPGSALPSQAHNCQP